MLGSGNTRRISPKENSFHSTFCITSPLLLESNSESIGCWRRLDVLHLKSGSASGSGQHRSALEDQCGAITFQCRTLVDGVPR